MDSALIVPGAPVPLRILTLIVAAGDVDQASAETVAKNWGPEVRKYLRNLDPPVDFGVPWCAAAVQWWSDRAARQWELRNPLDAVRLEAYVPSYYDHAEAAGWLVPPEEADAGCLVMFNFGGVRWDHVAILEHAPERDESGRVIVRSIDGNTTAPAGPNGAASREGDRVARKRRTMVPSRVAFARWDEEVLWSPA